MNIFKYFIFIITILISSITYADLKWQAQWKTTQTDFHEQKGQACNFTLNLLKSQASQDWTLKQTTDAYCLYYNTSARNEIQVRLISKDFPTTCSVGRPSPFKWWENESLPASVCLSKCLYVRPPNTPIKCVGIGDDGVEECGDFVSDGSKCDQPDPDPEADPKPPTQCKNASGSDAYCDKPATGCPSGYKEASFNNKQICVKNSTDSDPTKPNPNDPNNGGNSNGDGSCNGTNNCNTTNLDDSKIIAAINASLYIILCKFELL